MLTRFLGNSLGYKVAKHAISAAIPHGNIDLEKLKMLIEFFPIGKKLRYFPEFKEDIVFDTLIVAYCINGTYIYSGEAIDQDPEGYPAMFRPGDSKERIPIAELKLFQLLVPDTSSLEMKLDYQRRALIGKGRQFIKGNAITLISNAGGKGVSTIETEVDKQIDLQDGPYAHTNMILLTPEIKTLAVTDQRIKSRAKTCAPVAMSLLEGKHALPCTIFDISESTIRIRISDRTAAMPAMKRGEEVILEINLGESALHYIIKGTVIRRAADTCVIQMDGQFKDGSLHAFSPLDLMELKAGLLNYG